MIRKTLYAGSWYPANKEDIEEFIQPKAKKQKALAVVCPHAGWMYSGKVAGEVYSKILPESLYILIGPNHTGIGEAVSIFVEGEWETPLGNLTVDSAVARSIREKAASAQADDLAHLQEHSLEVQAPFIKYFSPAARIVPITLADYRPEVCRELGHAIAEAVREHGFKDTALLVASTDMSHYVAADYARQVDSLAIDKILRLDPEGLLSTVKENDISMCGSGPTAAVLWAAKDLGAQKAELVRYANSGDASGDFTQVVGYAGLIIT